MSGEPPLQDTWTSLVERLRSELPEDVYRVWLQPLRPVAVAGRVLHVHAPRETRDWVRRRFGRLLSATLSSLDPALERVEIVSESDPVHAAPAAGAEPGHGLNPALRFEDFVIASTNRFAHAAALAAAELPGQAYDPLFIYGPAGVGKSHLLHAIGNYVVAHDRAISVRYVTGEGFTSAFTSALRAGRMDAFKACHRKVDVLLLDDVQFVESKPRTAEELLHTFDVLLGAGAQIVLSADRAPGAMPALDSRLRDRLEGGLVVDLQPPDFEARLSIVRKRAGRCLGAGDDTTALDTLARRVSSSVHALEGALTRVRAYASLTQQPITSELVEHVVANLYGGPAGPNARPAGMSVEQIQSSTSAAMEVSRDDLTSAKRGRRVVYARQVAMYLSRELTDLSLPAIAAQFGGRDHTTVLHAHRQMRKRMLADADTRALVESILTQLGAGTTPP